MIAALLGLAAPASPARSMTITMPLCGGGSVPVETGDKPLPGSDPAACHAACATRRSDDDSREPPGTAT